MSSNLHLPPELAAQQSEEMEAQQQMFAVRNGIAEQLFLRNCAVNISDSNEAVRLHGEALAKNCVAAAEGYMIGMGYIKMVKPEMHG